MCFAGVAWYTRDDIIASDYQNLYHCKFSESKCVPMADPGFAANDGARKECSASTQCSSCIASCAKGTPCNRQSASDAALLDSLLVNSYRRDLQIDGFFLALALTFELQFTPPPSQKKHSCCYRRRLRLFHLQLAHPTSQDWRNNNRRRGRF